MNLPKLWHMLKVLLFISQAMSPEMHHSFGDPTNTELAHITVPLYRAAEFFFVTPQGMPWYMYRCR